MWQRFTESARRVVLLGQEEALNSRANQVGTEHLLLGLVLEPEGLAAQILKNRGVTLIAVRLELGPVETASLSHRSETPKLTPEAKRVLEVAADEARLLHHTYIGTEHLLLALLRARDSLGATILNQLGLKLEPTRAKVAGHLGPPPKAKAVPVMPPELPQTLPELPPFVSAFLGIYFTPAARQILLNAYYQCEQSESGRIGVEHLLLALMDEQNAAILRSKMNDTEAEPEVD